MSVQTSDDVYLAHRDALFGLAYRMLGSVADAEDVVAEAYLRWRREDRADVANARSYLFAIASRLALDLSKSAQRTRVSYVGSWLPEPLVTSYDDDVPAAAAQRTDTISLAFLHLLERLSPQERAVFVMRSAFDFPHSQIAEMLQLSPDHVRQLYRRAQQRLGPDSEPRYVPDAQRQHELVEKFLAAATTGEVAPFAALLAEDVLLVGDGGGKAASIRVPAIGRVRVARFLRGLVRKTTPSMSFEVVRANGSPAVLARDGADPIGLYALDIDPGADVIRSIHAIRNPDKLIRLMR